jgi:hypothetical protein
MAQVNYKQIPDLIKNRQVFTGNSAYAVWHGDTYIVYSYNTQMFRENNTEQWFNLEKYSSITSRLQHIIKRVIQVRG